MKNFEGLLEQIKSCSKKKLAVAVAQDDAVLEAVKAAKDKDIADAILVGDADKIKEIAASMDMSLEGFEIIDVKDPTEAALTAVKLVHDGEADMYMKGLIDTKGFLKSVLNKEVGLRTGKALSHVCLFEIEGFEKMFFLTDVAFIPYPTLEDKVDIISNTVAVAHACGIECPKVAPLAAVEVVNPKMPVTVDAAELTKMNEEGKITGCIVDGPLSMDLAIDPEAAKLESNRRRRVQKRELQGDFELVHVCGYGEGGSDRNGGWLWRHIRDEASDEDRNPAGWICGWIPERSVEPRKGADPWTGSTDHRKSLYGSVYGRCDRYPGCTEKRSGDATWRRPFHPVDGRSASDKCR